SHCWFLFFCGVFLFCFVLFCFPTAFLAVTNTSSMERLYRLGEHESCVHVLKGLTLSFSSELCSGSLFSHAKPSSKGGFLRRRLPMDTRSLPGMGFPECHLEGNLQCNFKEPNMSLGVGPPGPQQRLVLEKKSHTPFKRRFSEDKTEASVSPPSSSTPCMVCFCGCFLVS
uniref:Uncharacterized protein n=1 Tax=Pavo cristatus TaxID=9049 RepID=A0A8C9FCA8_PAVCR